MVIGETWNNNGNCPNERAVYVFTLNFGGPWMEHTKFTASDGASTENFGRSVAFSGDTLIVGATYKDFFGEGAYACVLAGYVPWDEGTRLITRKGNISVD